MLKPSQELVYAMAFDQADMLTYLVQFDWNSGPTLWPMHGYSEDPTAIPFMGNAHLDSIIYQVDSSASDNFPVKGYLVGKTKSIWTFNACNAPDFGLTPAYE